MIPTPQEVVEEMKLLRSAIDGLVYHHVDAELSRAEARRHGAIPRDGGRIICQQICVDTIMKHFQQTLTTRDKAIMDVLVAELEKKMCIAEELWDDGYIAGITSARSIVKKVLDNKE